MNLKLYMKKTKVTKRTYVDKWIDEGLIPGAVRDGKDYSFPESARRPYRDGHLKAGMPADKIRAHIVKASLLRQHISAPVFYMSEGEFKTMIADLESANLLTTRIEDGITYYDSTQKTRGYTKKPLHEIGSFVQGCLRSIAEGATTAAIDALTNGN